MQLIRLACTVLITLLVAAEYWRERHRLATLERLTGSAARAYLEASQRRDDRLMLAVTVAFVLLGGAAATYLWIDARA